MKISEAFCSLQGEGINSGVPSMFIRFPGCNLICGGISGELVKQGKATWHCDSEKQWQSSIEVSAYDICTRIPQSVSNIIFTGGEPTLHLDDMREIMGILEDMVTRRERQPCTYEMETNGTRLSPIFSRMDVINCSPKLKNSGMPDDLRINEIALAELRCRHNVWWKFVVASEEDILEAIETYHPALDRVLLMPAGDNREEVIKRTAELWPICTRLGLRMTNRLQIIAFNRKLGV